MLDPKQPHVSTTLDDPFINRDYAMTYGWTVVHGVAHVDKEGRFIDCNQAYCDILGRSKGDVVGHLFHEFTAPADIVADERNARDIVAGYINRYSIDKNYVLPNGKTVLVQLEVRRYPWDVREEFQHFVVHCYYKPPMPSVWDALRANKMFGALVAGVGAVAGAIAGNLDVIFSLARAAL